MKAAIWGGINSPKLFMKHDTDWLAILLLSPRQTRETITAELEIRPDLTLHRNDSKSDTEYHYVFPVRHHTERQL